MGQGLIDRGSFESKQCNKGRAVLIRIKSYLTYTLTHLYADLTSVFTRLSHLTYTLILPQYSRGLSHLTYTLMHWSYLSIHKDCQTSLIHLHTYTQISPQYSRGLSNLTYTLILWSYLSIHRIKSHLTCTFIYLSFLSIHEMMWKSFCICIFFFFG